MGEMKEDRCEVDWRKNLVLPGVDLHSHYCCMWK